jgi:DNA-binding beta-propeller fold protein YncE
VATTWTAGVRKIAPSGTSTVIATAFTSPWGIAVDSNGNVLVADHATNVISKLTPNSSGTSYTQSTFLKAGTLVSPVEMGNMPATTCTWPTVVTTASWS